MNKPVVADIKPHRTELKAGADYYFCVCGLSASQPFCDGSHKTTDLNPQKFVAAEDGDAFLCMCKHSANLPYCDGAHKQFPADAIGKQGPGPD